MPITPTNAPDEDGRPQLREFNDDLTPADRAVAILDTIIKAKGGSPRNGQIQMARSVAKALSEETPYMPQAGTGTGKALDVDTLIPTPSGFKRMGDLKAGDLVFDENGQVTRVTHAFDVMHNRICYLVTFNDGSTIVADAEHSWDTQTISALRAATPEDVWGGARTRTTQDIADTLISTTGRCEHRIPLAAPLCIEEGEEMGGRTVPAYMLGAWLAGLRPGGGASFARSDHLNMGAMMVRAPGATQSVRVGQIKGTGRRVEITPSRHIRRHLEALGATVAGASIPEQYIFAPEKHRRSLMRGLLDVSGHVSNGQVRLYDHRRRFVEDVATLAASLGYRANITRREGVSGQWGVTFTTGTPVFGAAAKNETLGKFRGRSTAGVRDRVLRRTIVSVEEVPSRPVRCISVDSPRHLYLAGRSMVPTHNSIAYLAGALASGRQTVIAPHTKALQDQLRDDLELVASAFPEDGTGVIPQPTYALIKGRSSYLCLSKVKGDSGASAGEQESLLEGLVDKVTPTSKIGKEVSALAAWADETDTGERSHLTFAVSDKAWNQVSTTPDDCTKSGCPFVYSCFAEKARSAAVEADIIVVNQALLATWIKYPQILPETVGAVVVDEAHEFPGVVADSFGAEITPGRIKNTIARYRTAFRAANVEDSAKADLAKAEAAAEALGKKLVFKSGQRDIDMNLPGEAEEQMIAMASAITSMVTRADTYITALTKQAEAKKKSLLRQGMNLRSDLYMVGRGKSDQQVVWAERRKPKGETVLRAAQFDVSEILFKGLLRPIRNVVFTSATLSVGGSFDIPASNFGFSRGPWFAEMIESPFDYDTQGLIWTPTGMPKPNASNPAASAAYLAKVADIAEQVARAAGGRTLVLCTSRASVKTIYEHLTKALKKTDSQVLAQGVGDLSTKELAKRFTEDPRSVLVGTRSFWTGISVEGDTCAAVVIDKTPFPSPADPIISARSDKADRLGGPGAGFRTVSLAEACLTLVQGSGRLIRTVRDRGVIVLCDPRIHPEGPHRKFYAQSMLRSLPPFPMTKDADQALALLREVNAAADDAGATLVVEEEEGE